MSDAQLRVMAEQRLKKKSGFRQYLWIWLGVSVLLTVIWALSTPGGYFWPVWAIAGMGIGALFAGIDAYGKEPKVITDQEIDAEMARMRQSR